MLEAAVIAMTVMGCNHQSQDCEIIAQPPKVWQSQAACDAAIPKIIEGSMEAPYPVIVARCQTKTSKTATAEPQPQSIGTPKPEIQVVELPAPPQSAVQAPAQPPAKTDTETSDTPLPPIAKLAFQKTTEGWTLVRKGASDGMDKVSGSVKSVVGGVKSVVGDAVDLAERGADAVRDALVPQD